MYKLKIITVGKIKHQWLRLALNDYEERLKNTVNIQWLLFKEEEKWAKYLEKENEFICLDQKGKDVSSENFANIFLKKIHTSIVIGPHQGIPKNIKKRASLLIKLSSLTFTHQMTRLILLEQIYRSLEIFHNRGYNK